MDTEVVVGTLLTWICKALRREAMIEPVSTPFTTKAEFLDITNLTTNIDATTAITTQIKPKKLQIIFKLH